MKEYQIGKNDAGQRLDKFLAKTFPLLPNVLAQKYIRTKHIKTNGKKTKNSYKLMEGDLLQLYISDELLEIPTAENAYLKVTPNLNILYEDAHILLVDKQPGMSVHADDHEKIDTLISHIQAYLYQKGDYNPQEEQSFAPALCNRLDRNTGGIVIAAKDAESLRIMNEKMKHRELTKLYLCIVHGTMRKKKDTLKGYLLKNSNANKVHISARRHPDSLEIETAYRVIREADHLTLLEVNLLTGRTHQIRAHLASIGHPILGDGKYGKLKKKDCPYHFSAQALYSYKLIFDFKSDAGILQYLHGKAFQVADVPFVKLFDHAPLIYQASKKKY